MKSQGISRKKSVGSLGNIPRPTSRLQCKQRLLQAQVTLAVFPYAPRLLSGLSCLAINGSSQWKYSEGNVCYCSVTNVFALIPSFFSTCTERSISPCCVFLVARHLAKNLPTPWWCLPHHCHGLTAAAPRGLVQLSTNPILTGWFVQKIDGKPPALQPSYRKTVGFRETNRISNHVLY